MILPSRSQDQVKPSKQKGPCRALDPREHRSEISVKPTMKQSLFLALSCVLIGCSTLPTADEHRRDLQPRLRALVIEDGINEQEANVIAENYFLRFSPIICGSVARVTDDGTSWVARTCFGLAAMPTREPIRVDKSTGRVTWSDGPTIQNSKAISNQSG